MSRCLMIGRYYGPSKSNSQQGPVLATVDLLHLAGYVEEAMQCGYYPVSAIVNDGRVRSLAQHEWIIPYSGGIKAVLLSPARRVNSQDFPQFVEGGRCQFRNHVYQYVVFRVLVKRIAALNIRPVLMM